jgi:phosphoribosylformylglycinamidine synthase
LKFGVVTFPGSNCDYDAFTAVRDIIKQPVEFLWHRDGDLKGCDVVILPGGFSYGDYLRAGSIARFSPLMKSVIDFARSGGLVWGICNGFQILLEAGLLPGAMLRNRSLRFSCRQVYLKTESTASPYTRSVPKGTVLQIPIAHAEGNYYAPDETLDELERSGRVAFRYCGPEGELADEFNPNGSARHIAGILSEKGNILGMMPHPERAVEEILGSADGRRLFESVVQAFADGVVKPGGAAKAEVA